MCAAIGGGCGSLGNMGGRIAAPNSRRTHSRRHSHHVAATDNPSLHCSSHFSVILFGYFRYFPLRSPSLLDLCGQVLERQKGTTFLIMGKLNSCVFLTL